MICKILANLLLFLGTQASCFSFIGNLTTYLVLKCIRSLIRDLVLVINLALSLDLLSALCSLRLLQLLRIGYSLIVFLRIIVLFLLLLHLCEFHHSLLLLHDLIQSIDFKLFLRASALSFSDLNLFDAFVVILCLGLHI